MKLVQCNSLFAVVTLNLNQPFPTVCSSSWPTKLPPKEGDKALSRLVFACGGQAFRCQCWCFVFEVFKKLCSNWCKGKDELIIQSQFCVFPALCFSWEKKTNLTPILVISHKKRKIKKKKDIFDHHNKLLTDATVLLGQYYKIAGKCFFLYLNIVEKISYNCYKAGHSLLFFLIVEVTLYVRLMFLQYLLKYLFFSLN